MTILDLLDRTEAGAEITAEQYNATIALIEAVVNGSVVTSDASPFSLTDARSAKLNVDVRSHAASVDFEVPAAAVQGSKWVVYADHAGCVVSVAGDAGSVNGTSGGSVEIVEAGVVVVDVESNAGSAPVVTVGGEFFAAMASRGATTVTKADHDRIFAVTGTQTFGAASGFPSGFAVSFVKQDAGDITIDGVDADHTITGPGAVTVYKAGTALLAVGSDGVTVLDAA